jgi:hypothetical protein
MAAQLISAHWRTPKVLTYLSNLAGIRKVAIARQVRQSSTELPPSEQSF